jgi:hypothetical protein
MGIILCTVRKVEIKAFFEDMCKIDRRKWKDI